MSRGERFLDILPPATGMFVSGLLVGEGLARNKMGMFWWGLSITLLWVWGIWIRCRMGEKEA